MMYMYAAVGNVDMTCLLFAPLPMIESTMKAATSFVIGLLG
jgi:hypothetical protein